jgi:hypothetical protein
MRTDLVLKWTLNKQGVLGWTPFTLIRLGSSGGPGVRANGPSSCTKSMKILDYIKD